MEHQELDQLKLNPLKAGIQFNTPTSFRSKKIYIKTPKGRHLESFEFTPLLKATDAKRIAKYGNYEENLCIEICKSINFHFCRNIAFHFTNHADMFDLPKEMKYENVKNRVIDKASLVLNLYETSNVKEEMWLFAARFLMDKNSHISKEVESATQIEFNRLVLDSNHKNRIETTLPQQILLLEQFGIVEILNIRLKYDTKISKLLSYLLNKDEGNIRKSLGALRDSRKDEKKPVHVKRFGISNSNNLNFLYKVLIELKSDKE
jgi:hypothetical protein